MLKAIKDFFDLKDDNYLYKTGDEYPRSGYKASAERIEELSSSKNASGYPLIADDAKEIKKPKKQTKKTKQYEE